MESIVVNSIFQDPESDSAKAFSRDLRKLISLTDVQNKIVLADLPRLRLARTNIETEQIIKEIAEETKLNVVNVNRVMILLKNILNWVLDTDVPDDDYEKWADDLEEISVLHDSEEKKVFKDLVENIQLSAVNQVEPEVKRRKAAQAKGPLFKSFSVSTGILPVNEGKYEKALSYDDYEPKMVDTVAFATIALVLHEGPFKEIFFNVEEYDIDIMLDALRAAKKDIAALRKFLKI